MIEALKSSQAPEHSHLLPKKPKESWNVLLSKTIFLSANYSFSNKKQQAAKNKTKFCY